MPVIPEKFQEIFQKKAFAHIATIMPDGSPHVTPLWCEYDGDYIRINSARGRVKDKNMRRDSRVALSIQDPDNAYRYIQVRGRVVEITEQGAEEHVDKLAKKYTGVDKYKKPSPDQVRVIYKIKPEKANTMG